MEPEIKRSPSRTKTPLSRGWVVAFVSTVMLVTLLVMTVRYNRSPSVPMGVYLRMPQGAAIERGDYVFACLDPGEYAQVGLARGYLARGGWDCQVRMAPLIKRVVAVVGDTVVVNEEGVFRNGAFIALPPKAVDSKDRPLWVEYGMWILGEGDFWLGSDAPYGYDSRYLGPFTRELIVRKARPLLLLP